MQSILNSFEKNNLKENKHLDLGAKIEIKKFVNCFETI